MSEVNSHTAGESGSPAVSPTSDHFRCGMSLLWQSWTYAQDAGADMWDFALEINALYEAGLTISDLRWLVSKAYAEHGQETSIYGDAHRSFRLSDGLTFTGETCFLLTPTGADFVGTALKDSTTAH